MADALNVSFIYVLHDPVLGDGAGTAHFWGRRAPPRQQSGLPAALWHFLPLGEPGLLLQGRNLAEPSRLWLVSSGLRPLTSSRMPRARTPGVLSWVIKRVEVKEHPFREPRGTTQTPLLPGDCGPQCPLPPAPCPDLMVCCRGRQGLSAHSGACGWCAEGSAASQVRKPHPEGL